MSENRDLSWLFDVIKNDAILLRKKLPHSIRSRSGKGLAWLVDMRQIFMRAEVLEFVSTYFWEHYASQWPFQVGGLATGAIPFVTAIMLKGRQLGFEVTGHIVRKERNTKGMCKQVEGDLSDLPVIIVDDLLNSGSSVERVRLALEQEGKTVAHAFFLLDFDLESTHEYLAHHGIVPHALFTAEQFELPTKKPGGHGWEEPTMAFDWVFMPDNPNYSFGVPNSNPVCDDSMVYFGGSDAFFYALEQETGDVIWRFRVGKTPKSILSSPVLHNGVLYFGAYDGNIYALQSKTGQPLWRNTEADFIGSSPAIAPELGLLFIGVEFAMPGNRGAIAALSLATGETIWWFPVKQFLHGSPCYMEDCQRVAIGTNDHTVMAFEAASGELCWSFDAGGEVKHGLAYDAERRLLCFGSFDGNIYGIDADTGKERFRVKTENIVYATPLIVGDRLFCPSTDRAMYVISLETGKLIRKISSYGKMFSSPALLNGLVFWGGNDGILRGVDPETLVIKQWIRVPERLLSRPTWHNERLYILGAGSTCMALRCLPPKAEEATEEEAVEKEGAGKGE